MRCTTGLAAGLAAALCLAIPAAAAQKSLDRNDEFPAAEGKRLVVDSADVDLRVQLADVDSIRTEVLLHIANTGEDKAQRWIENHTPTFEDGPDTLRVFVEPAKTGFLGFGSLSLRARLGIMVTDAVVPDLTTSSGSIRLRGDFPLASPLRLRSLTGDITMVGAAESLHVDGGDGDVQIDVVRPLEEFRARTSVGEVRLTGGARQTRVDTGSGKISLSNLSGSLEASTSNGRITVVWDKLGERHHVRIRSASGRVHLQLPADVRPQGRLTTTTGNIRSEFPGLVTEDGSTLELHGTGPTFDVETASGEIQLTIRDGWD